MVSNLLDKPIEIKEMKDAGLEEQRLAAILLNKIRPNFATPTALTVRVNESRLTEVVS
jgi:hypothetical protein